MVLRNSHDTTKDQTFIFQLITDDAWGNQQNAMVTVQSLLERSLHSSNVQFDEVRSYYLSFSLFFMLELKLQLHVNFNPDMMTLCTHFDA